MEEMGLGVPKTQDLDLLVTILLPHHSVLRKHRRGLIFLSDFAVDPRYPGYSSTKREGQATLRWADRVRTTCRTLLDIRPPRTRKRKQP